MKKQAVQIILSFFLALPCWAQYGNTTTISGSGAPSGSCSFLQMYNDTTNGNLYFCGSSNTWVKLGTGSGSGTVTSFSSGNLSPLFTTSVATATTTPALSFSLTNAAGGTLFGNNTASSAAPAYNTTPTAGVQNTTQGTFTLAGSAASSGSLSINIAGASANPLTIVPGANAGTVTLTGPTTGGTIPSAAVSPVTLSAAGSIGCATCATTTNGGALSGTAPVAISAAGAISITGAAGQVLAGSGPAFTATPTLGTNASATGTLGLANGSASGVTTTISPAATTTPNTITLATVATTEPTANPSVNNTPLVGSTAGVQSYSTTVSYSVNDAQTDSTTAIKDCNAAGSTCPITLDTTNDRVGVGNVTPGATLDVSGKFQVGGASGNISKSNNTATIGIGAPFFLGAAVNLTSSTSSAAQTLHSNIPVAGSYRISWYADPNVGTCSVVGTGGVTFQFAWTDAVNARTLTTASMPLVTAQTAASYAQGSVTIFAALASTVTVTPTFTQCGTGAGSYDLHAIIERVQ